MGIVLDTCVFIDYERQGVLPDFQQWKKYKYAYISAITVTELLIGVYKADSKERQLKRSAFVEAILAKMPVLDFNASVARIHAQLYADLSNQGKVVGAHDLIIAATAIAHDCAILTANLREFERILGLKVISYK